MAWAHMHLDQGEVVTLAALRGSMAGWDDPAAQPAIKWKPIRLAVAPTRESRLPTEQLTRALSIRQPLSELILTGEKTEEYRCKTTIHRRSTFA